MRGRKRAGGGWRARVRANEIRTIFKRGEAFPTPRGFRRKSRLRGSSREDSFYRSPYNLRMSPTKKLPKWLKSLGCVLDSPIRMLPSSPVTPVERYVSLT